MHMNIIYQLSTAVFNDHISVMFVVIVFEISVDDGEKLVRPTDFMKYVHANDEKVLDRELDEEYYKYW